MVGHVPPRVAGCVVAHELCRTQLVPAWAGGREGQAHCGTGGAKERYCRSASTSANKTASRRPPGKQAVVCLTPHPPVSILQLHIDARDAAGICCRSHNGGAKLGLEGLIAAHVVKVMVGWCEGTTSGSAEARLERLDQ